MRDYSTRWLIVIASAVVLILFGAPLVVPILIGVGTGAGVFFLVATMSPQSSKMDPAFSVISVVVGVAVASWAGAYLWSPLVELFYRPDSLVISGIVSGGVLVVALVAVLIIKQLRRGALKSDPPGFVEQVGTEENVV
jgi:ABC-type cobalamin transport system permease subunit